MTLRVSGKNLAIGEALRTHVHDRIECVVAKYHAGLPNGHVTIEPEGSAYRTDCTLFLTTGITLQVEAIAHEPYSSFDKAADRIERRLRDHRKRLTSRHGEGVSGDPIGVSLAEAKTLPNEAALDDGFDEIDDESEPTDGQTFPVVVAEHAQGFKEMTVAAAVHELDEKACSVVIFRYAENSRINIVYRRPDGNIGWIDPLGAANGRSGQSPD
jgi:ribosomal subunit interface protein